ncbi:ribonuclease P protein subunit p25-like protein-like [Platysternon megacephalum]|uniref:Ribonuclease P protein subunit p25-like protein-like n=1 Tax=Platysternon megacephalum TaxID=55544 RepID=A0A4D9E0R3_9SAUR|nr:ribonuclease P protein subunit p25-like protein-like [Platysternon megacephalum]
MPKSASLNEPPGKVGEQGRGTQVITGRRGEPGCPANCIPLLPSLTDRFVLPMLFQLSCVPSLRSSEQTISFYQLFAPGFSCSGSQVTGHSMEPFTELYSQLWGCGESRGTQERASHKVL